MKRNSVPLTPASVRAHLAGHFEHLSTDHFLDEARRYCPDMFEEQLLPREIEGQSMSQLVLFQPSPSRIPLDAYLASALTGLGTDQRHVIFQLSDTVATVCKSHGIELYEPRKKTDPVHHAEVPDAEVFRIDRERVLGSDLLIHLCHYPSTGAGEELEFANASLVPIILISHSESRVSRMITGIPGFKVQLTYSEPEQLRMDLDQKLSEIRPFLEERKLAFSEYKVNLVGDRVRARREELGLTREDVASASKLLTPQFLRQMEESEDRLANPTLLQLRQLAVVLKTTVADLVEPDLGERVVNFLEDWVTNRAAARFRGIDERDRNRLIRRILLRVVDSLED